jgi:hypothetical protein
MTSFLPSNSRHGTRIDVAPVAGEEEGGEHMQQEREIDALLTPGEAGSIIDRLMALPHSKDGARKANEWDRAVAARLETALAKSMRSRIVGEDRDAA